MRAKIAQVDEHRTVFLGSSSKWLKEMPDEFMNMDFQFVLTNSDQFESVGTLRDVAEAKRLLWRLGEALTSLEKHEEVHLGAVTVPQGEGTEMEAIEGDLLEFEEKAGRPLARPTVDKEAERYHPELEGLKLRPGLTYLREAGELYYGIQTKVLELQLEHLLADAPTRGISVVHVEGLGETSLCTICRTLLGNPGELIETETHPEEPTAIVVEVPLPTVRSRERKIKVTPHWVAKIGASMEAIILVSILARSILS